MNTRRCVITNTTCLKQFAEDADFKIPSDRTSIYTTKTAPTCPRGNTTVVVVVRFGYNQDATENNFILTAYYVMRRRATSR